MTDELAGMNLDAAAPDWGLVRRILFRFGFSYLLLYLLPTFLGLLAFIPYAGIAVGWYFELWAALVPWVGKHVLRVDALLHPTGSGDSMYSWTEVFCYLAVAALAALVWTLVDRKRKSYPRLYEGLRVYVRLGLGVTMIQYGAFKIIPSQFPHPSLDRLLQSIGDSSPMGILWTFMGASAPYTIFAGLTEWIGGALLLFRRTMRLGALVSITALTNVVVLNFCYDVPVKQYSAHLLAMAVFLAAPDLRRLADLLVLNRHVPPAEDRPLFRRRWPQLGGMALEIVATRRVHRLRPEPELSTIPVVRHGEPAAARHLGGRRARRRRAGPAAGGDGRLPVALRGVRLFQPVFHPADEQLPPALRRRLDAGKKTLALTKRDDPAWKSALSYQQPGPGRLTLDGTFDGRKVQAALHRIDAPRSLLVTRGFHWVSEYPFNR